MKIGMFSEIGNPQLPPRCGVSNLIHKILEHSEQQRTPVDLWTYADQNATITHNQTTTHLVKPLTRTEWYPGFPQDFPAIINQQVQQEAKAQDYDIIVAATQATMGLNAWNLHRETHIPLIGFYTTNIADYLAGSAKTWAQQTSFLRPELAYESVHKATWAYLRFFHDKKRMSLTLTPSEHTKKELQERLPNAYIDVLSRGVDTQRFTPNPLSTSYENTSNTQATILSVGRLHTQHKNLQALVDLHQALPELNYLVVGEGPSRQELEGQLGPHAHFTGKLKGQDLVNAYQQADLFFMPSTLETFGQVALEAMACGLPVVCNSQGATKELIKNGYNGFAVPQAEFPMIIKHLSENPELRRTIGKNARTYASKKTWSSVHQQFIDYCSDIVREEQRPQRTYVS